MSFLYAGAAAIVVGAAVYNGEQARKGANKQADAIRAAADEQARVDKEIAERQQKQAEESLQFQKDLEEKRRKAQLAAEAEQRRQAADAANASLSLAEEPTVQLAATGGQNDTMQRNKRRAQFRPEYASGVSI